MQILSAIENAMDTTAVKIYWKDIASAAGIKESTLSHFKSGSELKFPTLLKIAKFIYKDKYMTPFKSWCLSLQQPKNIRYALEYLALNRHKNELEQVINKIYSEHPTKELTDWADVYSILLSYIDGKDASEILIDLRAYAPKYFETKLLAIIIEIYCKNKTKEYTTMVGLSEGLSTSISEIKEDFIRKSFDIRLKEILSHLYLYRFNKPQKAREYAEKIIFTEISANLSTNASYIVGMSYLFESYDQCLGNILEYRKNLIKYGRHSEANIVDECDLPFIKSVWNKHSDVPQTSDISELAHYEALYGSKEKALELANNALEQQQTGFRLYYKALATNDKSIFMQSLILFVNKKGDKFFANLPYEHIKGDPIYQPMADLLLFD